MDKNKPKNYNYVMVFTENGPKYVTAIDYKTRTCSWYGASKPMRFNDVEDARDMALRLAVNGSSAVAVSSLYEIENQPYAYAQGKFEWTKNEWTKKGDD